MIPLFGSREKSAKRVVFVQSLLYCSQPLAAPIHPMPLQVFTAELKIIGDGIIIIDIICPGLQQQICYSPKSQTCHWVQRELTIRVKAKTCVRRDKTFLRAPVGACKTMGNGLAPSWPNKWRWRWVARRGVGG